MPVPGIGGIIRRMRFGEGHPGEEGCIRMAVQVFLKVGYCPLSDPGIHMVFGRYGGRRRMNVVVADSVGPLVSGPSHIGQIVVIILNTTAQSLRIELMEHTAFFG